ncbi:MAG: hypothetical protein HUU01_06170 [Saprospiraceae bacterium]|nr:hypothetical protein [Saprospiraceae bacterium]
MHRIRRQILELDLLREAGAYALQQRASRIFQEKVLPELDLIFTRLAPEGIVIQLDRLEIDLGALGENNWEKRFTEACIRQIEKQLAQLLADAPYSKDKGIRIKAQEVHHWEIFYHYLQNGVLPWQAKSISLRDLEKDLQKAMDSQEVLSLQNFQAFLRQFPAAIQRLSTQFSTGFTTAFTEVLLSLPAGWVSRVLDFGKSLSGQPVTGHHYHKFIEALILEEAPGRLPEVPDANWVASFLYSLDGGIHLDSGKNRLHRPTAPEPRENNRPGKLPDGIDHESKAWQMQKNREADQDSGSKEYQGNATKDPDSAVRQQPVPKLAALLHSQTGKPEEAAFGLPVANAGLVLFAPYLALFFRHLNYQIPDPDQHRAVYLLHYLATGAENPEEPLLLLPKLLCGMAPELPPDAPSLEQWPLTDQEKTEARQLCEAVVKNWPTLKNTSVEGLQNSFIRREGLVYVKDSKTLLLRVERTGQDVLLDTLPWTISVIKLPWMDFQLQVEW